MGESIIAFVVLEENSNLSEKMVKKICLSHLENFMIPKDIVFSEDLPKTPNGKIDKKLLSQTRII